MNTPTDQALTDELEFTRRQREQAFNEIARMAVRLMEQARTIEALERAAEAAMDTP